MLDLLPPSISMALPNLVKREVSKMSADEQERFLRMYTRKAKNSSNAYLYWLFFSHYLYLGRPGLFFVFLCTAGFGFLWWLLDIFRIAGMVQEYNADLATNIYRKLRIEIERKKQRDAQNEPVRQQEPTL